MTDNERFLPRQVVIEQFGSGGFRFPGYSHLGSLLVLPSGMRAWRPATLADISPDDLALVAAEADAIDVMLIGTGATMQRLPAIVTARLAEIGMQWDAMSTSSAIHTYNVLLAENRRVGAAMLAVDKAHNRGDTHASL